MTVEGLSTLNNNQSNATATRIIRQNPSTEPFVNNVVDALGMTNRRRSGPRCSSIERYSNAEASEHALRAPGAKR
jgi:hypothetical protein